MSDLTDYEINKRLAEIAGVNVREALVSDFDAEDPIVLIRMDQQPEAWSPLTDWGQLGPLRERERIWVSDSDDGTWFASAPPHCGTTEPTQRSPDLKRAICLAIIAAHEEGNSHE